MPTVEELFSKVGMELQSDTASRTSSPRDRLQHQVNRMLNEVSKYKNVDELDSENSNSFWWSNKPNGDKRRMKMKYANRVVSKTSQTVPNSLKAVKSQLEKYKQVIELSDDDTWAYEEERRAKEAAKKTN